MSALTVNVELSPDMRLVLTCLCAFYGRDDRQIIEMALEQLSVDSKLITDTIEARIEQSRNKKEG